MITQDDIEAFAADNARSIEAAFEFARRAEKGLPSDRWADGAEGDKEVAKGIRAIFEMNEMLSGAFLGIWADKMRESADAMRLHTGDSKYVQKQAQ